MAGMPTLSMVRLGPGPILVYARTEILDTVVLGARVRMNMVVLEF